MPNTKQIAPLVSASLTLALAAAAAEPPPQQTRAGDGELAPTVVTSARGYETYLLKTPGGVGSVGQRDIFELSPAGVADLSKFLSGVDKTGDSPWGADINIRGLSRNSVVVLVDGARLETPTPINARLGMILPSSIDRVEVLKGPVSALYGSGSLGGVVNVITKGGTFSDTPEFRGSWSLTAKSNPGGFSSSLWAGWSAPDHYLDVILGGRDYDSYEDGSGRTLRNSQYSDYQAIIKAGYKPSADSELRVQLQYNNAENIGIPAGHGYLPSQGQYVTYPDTSRGLLQLSYTLHPASPRWKKSEFELYYHFNRRNVIIDRFPAPAPVDHIRLDADHDTYGFNWRNQFTAGQHTVTAGIDVWHRTLWSRRQRHLKNGAVMQDKTIPDSTFTSAGVYGEDSWEVTDRLTLSFGARLDLIEVENDAYGMWAARNERDVSWSAHLGAAYELTDALSTKAIVSSGYRAASLEERYAFINLGGGAKLFGDPDLDPEQSLFLEWGLDYETEDLKLSASVFHNSLEDLIVLENIPGGPDQRYANVSEARLYGVEASADWRIAEGWNAFANLSYTRGRDTRLNRDLPGIAPFNGLVGLRYKHGSGVWAQLETQFASSQNRTPPGTASTGSWSTVNLRLGYRFETAHAVHSIYAGVDNLFDETYQNYLSSSRSGTVSLYEPGRSINFGWKTEF